MIADEQGLALTGADAEAAGFFDQAVRAFNLGYGDSIGCFDRTIEIAPHCVMAHLGKAWLFALATDPGAAVAGRAIADTARSLPTNAREAVHLAALDLTLAGAQTAAADTIDRLLVEYPHDMLAQETAFLLDLFLGRPRFLRDRPARALPLWSPGRPGYPTLLVFHAFGLEENGDYARAEDLARQVAELEPMSFWAQHTVAHVMEMQGRPEDGLGWMIAREPLWSTEAHTTQTHNWWHKALFHVEPGQYDAALAILDGPVTATQRPLGVSLTNASALLWRLDLLGCPVGERWVALADLWAGHADGRCSVFCDLHAAMAELGAGRDEAVEQRLAWMRVTAAGNDETAAIYREAGVPLVEGIIAFHRRQYATAADRLHPARFATQRIGGSHAQRDIVDWTLTEAAVRGGQKHMAVALAHERLALRPRSAVNRAFLRRAEGLAA